MMWVLIRAAETRIHVADLCHSSQGDRRYIQIATNIINSEDIIVSLDAVISRLEGRQSHPRFRNSTPIIAY